MAAMYEAATIDSTGVYLVWSTASNVAATAFARLVSADDSESLWVYADQTWEVGEKPTRPPIMYAPSYGYNERTDLFNQLLRNASKCRDCRRPIIEHVDSHRAIGRACSSYDGGLR